MGWPIVRRVGAAVAVSAAALAMVVIGTPAVSINRPWLTSMDRCALVALVAGAVLQWAVPRPALVWLVSVTAMAIACFATVGRPGRLEAVSAIAVALATPLLLVLIVKVPTSPRRDPGLVVGTVAIAVLGLARALMYDPFDDISCTGLCRHNPVAVSSDLTLAHNLGIVAAAATILITSLVVRRAIQSHHSSTRAGAFAANICVAAAATTLGVDAVVRLASHTVTVPSDATVAVLAVALTASVLVSCAVISTALDPLRARRDVNRVARMLGRTEGSTDVQEIFRKTLGDPTLAIGYWSDGVGYLDEHGELLDIPPSCSRIELTSRGLPLAVIVHRRDPLSSELLTQQLGSQALLAIHNEGLTLELNRNIREVARSRRGIVEVGDAERRDLERDLHDGAQQRMLALSFDLRRAERAAVGIHDTCSAEGFAHANALARTALEQLRHLAHGIHPAILNGGALEDALREFAAAHGRAFSIFVGDADRIPASVESTIYEVLTAVILDSTATPAILLRRDEDSICLAIDNVSHLAQYAVDRAEAVGGNCATTERGLEVTLPCAW